MRFRIHFTGVTVSFLRKRLDRAYQLGDKRLVRRTSALLVKVDRQVGFVALYTLYLQGFSNSEPANGFRRKSAKRTQ